MKRTSPKKPLATSKHEMLKLLALLAKQYAAEEEEVQEVAGPSITGTHGGKVQCTWCTWD